MARGKNAGSRPRITAGTRPNNGSGLPVNCNNLMPKKLHAANDNVKTVSSILESIDRHWEAMPGQAMAFILESLDVLTLQKLAKFWSCPGVVEYTRGGIAGSVCGASWFMALNYMWLGKLPEARALTLNGAFLHQCYVST